MHGGVKVRMFDCALLTAGPLGPMGPRGPG